jgi:hypothetical protein
MESSKNKSSTTNDAAVTKKWIDDVIKDTCSLEEYESVIANEVLFLDSQITYCNEKIKRLEIAVSELIKLLQNQSSIFPQLSQPLRSPTISPTMED